MTPKAGDQTHCKWCRRFFATTRNPLCKDPSADDLLKRRVLGSLECRPCTNFQKTSPQYSTVAIAELQQHLQIADNQTAYMEDLASWEEQRRAGKRRRFHPDTQLEASCSTSLQTSVGCGWISLAHRASQSPPSALQQEIRQFGQPRRQSRQGCHKKGMGAIEISQSGTVGSNKKRVLTESDAEINPEQNHPNPQAFVELFIYPRGTHL